MGNSVLNSPSDEFSVDMLMKGEEGRQVASDGVNKATAVCLSEGS